MKRTNTVQRSSFDFPGPRAVRFEFLEQDTIQITIPPTSDWRMPEYWNYQHLDARQITSLSGLIVISVGSIHHSGGGGRYTSAGVTLNFQTKERYSWGPTSEQKKTGGDLVVLLIANEALHRNVYSAELDRERFPRLDSTPLWLRGVFSFLSKTSPRSYERLLSLTSRIQRTMTLYAHDYHEDHGRIWFSRLRLSILPIDPVPRWVHDWETRSMIWISKTVGSGCYWVGKLLLGMNDYYAEYTPSAGRKAMAEIVQTYEK